MSRNYTSLHVVDLDGKDSTVEEAIYSCLKVSVKHMTERFAK